MFCFCKEVKKKKIILDDARAMEKSVDHTSADQRTEGKSLGKWRELRD